MAGDKTDPREPAGSHPDAAVLGRAAELAGLEDWLRSLGEWRPRESGSPMPMPPLLIEGPPGIGKTTLWAHAVHLSRLRGWQALTCRPARSEAGLPQAGLADLLRPVPDEALAALPPPQRRPLEVALLRAEAGSGGLEPRAVGTGLTALLASLAQARPLVLAVDDAQWLDSASARSVAFALRRLDNCQVGLIAAIRTPDPTSQPDIGFGVGGLLEGQSPQRLPVGPLSLAAIHQLFLRMIGQSFPRPILVRIHGVAGGNPFYSLEIARELIRLGVPPPGQPLPVPADHRELALLRLRRLPRATRDVLAALAATPRPTTAGLDLTALAPAEVADIVRIGPDGRVEFTHPLFASAVYSALPQSARRRLHRDLAERAASGEERARHLALAAQAADEETAAELDRASALASARGAADMAVELKELACKLTPAVDRTSLVRRELELADRRYFAGDSAGARRQLERSAAALPPGEDRARVLLELGSVLWAKGEADDGLDLMSRALREARSQALLARIHSRISALADDCDISVAHGEAALALLDEHSDPVLYAFALHNVALFRLYAGRGADHDAIEKGMALQRDIAAWEMSTVPAFWARNFDDFGTARRRFESLLRVCREQGDEASVSGLLTHLAVIEAMTGRMDRARALADEAADLASQTEQETLINMATWAQAQVLARSGEHTGAKLAAAQILGRLDARPDIILEGMARVVIGMVATASGDFAAADRQLTRADDIDEYVHTREPINNRFHADHAEAVIGLGDLARAQVLVARMQARAAAVPRPWILAVTARCAGLLNAAEGDLDQAQADFQRALAAHEKLDMPAERGRTLLALGRLHRRRNERQRAQERLSQAMAAFDAAGALDWLAVAGDELRRASGRRGRDQELTPTERQIARLAAAGLRNSEIAARLFLSPKTVEANLSRSYRKLGIRSRAALTSALAPGNAQEEPR